MLISFNVWFISFNECPQCFSSSDPEAETRFNSIEKLIIIFEIGGFPE